jgi:hypothetical protein
VIKIAIDGVIQEAQPDELLIDLIKRTGGTVRALHVIAGVMAVSIVLPLIISPPRRREERSDLVSLSGYGQRRSSMRLVWGKTPKTLSD